MESPADKYLEEALKQRNDDLNDLRQAEKIERERGNISGADAIARMIRQHTPKVS